MAVASGPRITRHTVLLKVDFGHVSAPAVYTTTTHVHVILFLYKNTRESTSLQCK
jgi:hypothetical protein